MLFPLSPPETHGRKSLMLRFGDSAIIGYRPRTEETMVKGAKPFISAVPGISLAW
jgi:hypothetical protein